MQILTLNIGSSSIKYQVFSESLKLILKGSITGIGTQTYAWPENNNLHCPDHNSALTAISNFFGSKNIEPGIICHRVVHGGTSFSEPTLINNANLAEIAKLNPLAPLHNPSQHQAIVATMQQFPAARQIAFFDTAFHQSMPEHTSLIPLSLGPEIRNYGFHGLNYAYVVDELTWHFKKPVNAIIMHLGNGASICAVENNKSIATSMGMTPNSGLIMGTRSGSIDPGLFMYLHNNYQLDIAAIDQLLNKESGLKSIAGTSDMRELESKALDGDQKAQMAIKAFTSKVRFYLGGYQTLFSNLDCIVFTGGIGENSALIRKQILTGMEQQNIMLDDLKNQNQSEQLISQHGSIPVYVIKANEEKYMAKSAINTLD